MKKTTLYDEVSVRAALDMLYLCGCVLTGATPDSARVSRMSGAELYEMSVFHSLTALVGEGIEQAAPSGGDWDNWRKRFWTAGKNVLRCNLTMDVEREQILAHLEEQGIWYMPLKGAVLKDLYPKMGLREMGDNDILFDPAYRAEVREYFVSRGYSVEEYEEAHHDLYIKPPFYVFEMHVELLNVAWQPHLGQYWQEVKSRLIPMENTQYGFCFTMEDFYLHLLTHAYVHDQARGIGFRFLIDMYVYLEHMSAKMDWAYIHKQLRLMKLTVFEEECRTLIQSVFSSGETFAMEDLPEEKQDLFAEFIACGTMGNVEMRVERRLKIMSRSQYIARRLTIFFRKTRHYHPVCQKHPWALPFVCIYEFVRFMFEKRFWLELLHVFRRKKK